MPFFCKICFFNMSEMKNKHFVFYSWLTDVHAFNTLIFFISSKNLQHLHMESNTNSSRLQLFFCIGNHLKDPMVLSSVTVYIISKCCWSNRIPACCTRVLRAAHVCWATLTSNTSFYASLKRVKKFTNNISHFFFLV